MAFGAARLLARGWRRGSRRWWWGTSAAMAAVFTMVLVVQGTFAGVERATDARVADFFTGDLRVTPGSPAAAPSFPFPNATLARAQLEAASGGSVSPRLESQFVLSRRALREAFLEEDRYQLGTPGTALDTDFYGIGVLSGLPFGDSGSPAVEAIRYNLVAGSLPGRAEREDDVVQVLMSRARLHDYLSPAERVTVGDPPDPSAFRRLTFEVTAAVVDPDTPYGKDVVRLQAQVVGVFDTGVDALDTFTLLASIEDVRRLVGEDPAGDSANAFTVWGGDSDAAADRAAQRGWGSEGPGGFAKRYVGEVIGLVRTLSLLLAGLFFLLPLFLVWHGLSQQMAMHQRELAVCQAIGIGPRLLSGALSIQVLWTMGVATAATVALVMAASRVADPFIAGLGLPVPVEFHVSGAAIAAVAVAGVAATAAALGLTLLRQARSDLAMALRAA